MGILIAVETSVAGTQHMEQVMPKDLPIWIERFAELLGCDSRPASIAVAIEDLLAERERQCKTIGRLRGRMAGLRRTEADAAG